MSKWGRLLGWAVLMVIIGLIPLAIGWGNLPDPVATHWGLGGAPNGSTPLPWVPVIGVGLVAVGLLTTSLFREKGQPTAEAFAMLGLMGGLGLALNITLVQLNSGVEVWTDAGEFSFWHLAASAWIQSGSPLVSSPGDRKRRGPGGRHRDRRRGLVDGKGHGEVA